jgi:hypothetical protein
MALFDQATDKPAGNAGPKMEAPLLEAGGYPARLSRIVDLGEQPGSKDYPEPQLKMALVFECLDEFMCDEEGKELPDVPREFDYEISYNADGYMSERSNIHKVMTALSGFGKPLQTLLGTPCTISLIQKGTKKDATKKYNKVTGVTSMRPKDAEKADPLKGETLFFSLDTSATKEMFDKLSTRGGEYSQQNKIKTALNLHKEAPQLADALGVEKPPVVDHGADLPVGEGNAADFTESDKQIEEVMGGTVPPAVDASVDPFA